MPDGFVKDTATPLLLRPREFIGNARDLVTLKAAVAEEAPRYAEIKAPITIITGDADKTVSTSIHSHPLAATAPNAKLIVLPGVGHMVQQAGAGPGGCRDRGDDRRDDAEDRGGGAAGAVGPKGRGPVPVTGEAT
jgi:hypothetical protein